MDETKIVGDAMAFQISGCNSTGREERYLHIGHSYTSQHPTLWADCVEKLVGFSLSKWVIALILLGRLCVDHDVSLWRAPTA